MNRHKQGKHVAFEEMSDVTDAKAIGVCNFAGVDHKSFAIQARVKLVKLKTRMIRVVESGDDCALQFAWQVLIKSHLTHPGDKRFVIDTVPGGSAPDSAFGLQLAERLLEGQDRVRWRREAELSVSFQPLPLCE